MKSPKISGYVKTFKEKINKLISLHIDGNKLLEKYNTLWTKIKDSKGNKLKTLPVYDNRYVQEGIFRQLCLQIFKHTNVRLLW